MPLPGITQTIRDGALGLLALGSEYHVKIGISTGGAEGLPQAYADPQLVKDEYKRGPLVEAAVHAIELTGKPVILVRAVQTTAGSVGTISQSGAGPLITATGAAPNDAYELIVEILVGGAVGTAQFRVSVDGGDTWSPAIATAASYVIGPPNTVVPDTGITIQFVAGTYVLGEQYTATCTAPAFDTTSLTNALNIAHTSVEQWRLVHIVGYGANGAASATAFAAAGARLTAFEADYRYAYAVMEAADDTDANLITAFAAQAHPRMMVCAGFEELTSSVDGRLYKRPSAWTTVARIMASAVSRDPGAVADGPLAGPSLLYRDEAKTPGLDAARFCVLRTHRGMPGFYVTSGRMMAAAGSDFSYCPNRQVLDVASRVTYEALLQYVNIDLLVDPDTGRLLEAEAQAIEARVLGLLREAVVATGDASDVQFVVNRTDNILSSQTLRAKTRVLPKAYARYVENEIAFRNPALEPPAP
jgi:hypothetical protein